MRRLAENLPQFRGGVLPPGDYPLTIDQIRRSYLVTGAGIRSSRWDSQWRLRLVNNLEILVQQLQHVGISQIFVDGSFVEEKNHPNDIDGYFECDPGYHLSGQLERDLNQLDPHQCWMWEPNYRIPHADSHKAGGELPMWHIYRVELYPHHTGVFAATDEQGHPLQFPSFFRKVSGTNRPKGIIKITG